MTSGCAGNGSFVSVEEKFGNAEQAVYQSQTSAKSSTGFHIVRRGDTLYSIAFRYGYDYNELARANRISSPYTIYPGQKIDVRKSSLARADHSATVSSPAVGKPTLKPSKPSPSVDVTVPSSPVAPVVVADNQPLTWTWPTNGAIKAQFSTKKPVNKGIDLSGTLGESVTAAAAGTVVYAGQGLRGYGNLVIIKHDDTFLSAYAHASRILVSEKEVVKAGQTIAETGSTGTNEVKLHFEIRKNGKPVDPLLYLPAR